ncbi:hypothetical protein SORBI_3005G125100 [Sorghum bicolor]|uniref:BZIP domain-containing protein n=1 Tax=Sorghum bicolor TaxID=4558 RepID=A0A1Z5RI97_SORBI|nr:hypothetical protein SORBI_3005G125100 [Sorghum bicolor]
MEPNPSSSSAAWTSSPAAVLEHGEPSVHATSPLLSPSFSPAPCPGLLPASGSGSESSSWYQQIPPSPAVALGDGSLSVHAHATSSQSLPSSSSFPTAGTFPMVGYDLFGNPEAAAASPLPTFLGGQFEQGESSSMAASVLPECPSPGLFGFADEFAAWPSEEVSSSFFSPSSAGGLAPQSSDNLAGFAQLSSDYEMELLPPIEEEEEIDVSAFLVSDPEDQLPNASWMASSPQMGGGGGGGASASWMAPGSTGNNWPPMLATAAASTCTMKVSTSSGSMACHYGGSSIGVASSIGGMTKPSSPVLPLVPPSSQGAGASSSNFNGFAQPSSSSVLAPLATNLQGPLLPVKQEVMECVDATARRRPDFISLVDDDEEDGLYQDVIPCSIPGINGWSRSGGGHSQGPSFAPGAESRYNVFGSWGSGSSSTASFAPGSWLGSSSNSPSFGPGSWGGGSSSSPSFAPGSWGSSSGSPSFAPGSWGGGGSSSSSPSFAPGSWGGGGSSSPSFAPGSWGGGGSSSPSFAPGSWGCGSSSRSFAPGSWGSSSGSPSFAPSSLGGSSSSSPSFAPGSWGGSSSSRPSFAGSMPCFGGSTPIDNCSSSMAKLSIGGKMPSTSGLPPLPRCGIRSKKRGAGIVFTDPETAIIVKDKKLQELLRRDPKKLKRLLYNREYSAVSKVRKVMHTTNLETTIVTLEEERKSLCAKLQSLEEGTAALMAEKTKMQIIIGELEQQTMLKDVVREGLRAEIQNLKHQKLTNKPSTTRREPMHG